MSCEPMMLWSNNDSIQKSRLSLAASICICRMEELPIVSNLMYCMYTGLFFFLEVLANEVGQELKVNILSSFGELKKPAIELPGLG